MTEFVIKLQKREGGMEKSFPFSFKGLFPGFIAFNKSISVSPCPKLFQILFFVCKTNLNVEDIIFRGIYFPVVL